MSQLTSNYVVANGIRLRTNRRAYGIVAPQFALLTVIAKIGPASRAEIGRFHRQDRSTLTRNLKSMLSAGWIEEVQE